MNWNLGEENTQSTEEQRAMAKYIKDIDPYDHNIVVHTYPNQQDKVYRPHSAEILVVGTGRVGLGAYKALHELVGNRVWGMDADRDRIARQIDAGMHVFAGDAENADVWDAIDVSAITLVMLAIPSIDDCLNVAEQLKHAGYNGPIAAIARYEDERQELLDATPAVARSSTNGHKKGRRSSHRSSFPLGKEPGRRTSCSASNSGCTRARSPAVRDRERI